MLLLIFIAIFCSIISWRYPMAGLAIAINTHVFRCSVQAWILGRAISPYEGGYLLYSAAFIAPALGIPLIKLAWKIGTGAATFTNVRWNPVDVGLIALATALLLGCLYGPDADLALGIATKFVGLGLVYYVFARNWLNYQKVPGVQAEIFMKWTWSLALLAGLTAIAFPEVEVGREELTRLTTESANPIPFSLLIGTALLINCYWLLEKTKRTRFFKLMLLIGPPILIYLFVGANTRGPLISFAMAFVFLISGTLLQRGQVKTLIKIAAVTLFLVAAWWVVWEFAPELFERLGGRMEDLFSHTADSVVERQGYYGIAWRLFSESPVFGVGTGGVEHYAGGFAHDIVLEVAAENGIIGLVPLGLFIGCIFYYFVFSAFRKKEPLCIFLASCAIYYFLWATVSGTLFSLKHLYFTAGMLVFFVHYEGDRLDVVSSNVVRPSHSTAAQQAETY